MRIKPADWSPQGINELEPRAWDALREVEKNVLVTAGAGAGKTEFLAQKASYLLQTGLCPEPKRILAISFKRDAAENLAARVRQRCDDRQSRRFVSLTFDAFTKSLVDQFRSALPASYRPPSNYMIDFPNKDTWEEFFRSIDEHGVNSDRMSKAVAWARLPIGIDEMPDVWKERLLVYWHYQFNNGKQPSLTFPMINRLVEYLIRENAQLRRALRATYPFVFLDEFQDTTGAQFDIVRRAFEGTDAVLTAVGDDKQKIMGWAGAMPKAFGDFTAAFSARRIQLLSNWRSHGDLVALQQIVAEKIDPTVEQVKSRRDRSVDGDVAAIWQFSSIEEELDQLADWIEGEIANGNVQPHRMCILVRNTPHKCEKELAPKLAERGISLRNVAREVGKIAIQDLLAESLTESLLPFLRLGADRRRADAWTAALDRLKAVHTVSMEDELGLQRIGKRAQAVSRAIRRYMAKNKPHPRKAEEILSVLLDELGEKLIRQHSPSYRRDVDYQRVRDGFVELLKESLDGAASWAEAIGRFEGINQIPLMTVHKSKGLEFHTIIFFGLDNSTWWSLKESAEEELNSFFVAFTRAEQRAFFTCCQQRGGRIAWLENLFGDALPRRNLAA